MPDEEDPAKAGADPLARPVAALIDELAGSPAAEVGMTLGDTAYVFRLKRAFRLHERVKRIAAEHGHDPSAVVARHELHYFPLVEKIGSLAWWHVNPE